MNMADIELILYLFEVYQITCRKESNYEPSVLHKDDHIEFIVIICVTQFSVKSLKTYSYEKPISTSTKQVMLFRRLFEFLFVFVCLS